MLISFEGIDGCGKTTQAGLFAGALKDHNIDALLVREPGGTVAGEQIREMLLNSRTNISTETEILLYAAARAELLQEVIIPAVQGGRLIVCDRYIDSSMSYQGYGLGGNVDWILSLNRHVAGRLWPVLTFLLDLPVEEALARRTGLGDRIEQRDIKFHERVRRGYLFLASRERQRFVTLDARRPVEKLRQAIWEEARKRCPAIREQCC